MQRMNGLVTFITVLSERIVQVGKRGDEEGQGTGVEF